MPEYLATGRNAEGKKVTERVEADSADDAIAQLRERGFDEIVLHTDDVGALYSRQADVAKTFSPREFLWFRALPRSVVTFLPVCLLLYKRNWFTLLLALAVLLYRRAVPAPWGVVDTLLAAYLVLPLAWALVAQLLPSAAARYEQLVEAAAWGRWEEVLARADDVGPGIPPEELAFRRAGALAGLGRLDEAVHLVQRFGDGAAIPAWL
ncbi:MAG TPA: hypothetical protein VFC51_17855, partial [Chloroflexota bacterium]|nr:hypothetical protein [Chloroflexota bacterium]